MSPLSYERDCDKAKCAEELESNVEISDVFLILYVVLLPRNKHTRLLRQSIIILHTCRVNTVCVVTFKPIQCRMISESSTNSRKTQIKADKSDAPFIPPGSVNSDDKGAAFNAHCES